MTEIDTKKSGINPIIIAVILLILGLGAWMLLGRQQPLTDAEVMENSPAPTTASMMEEVSPTTDPETTGVLGTTSMENAEVKTFELEGGSFYFKPDVIQVKKGDRVKVVLNSVDMMHDFVIDELDVKTEIIKSGDSGTVEFTADTVGTFEFYCSVGEHRAQGMVGELIVE